MTKEQKDLAVAVLETTTEFSIGQIKYEVFEFSNGDFDMTITQNDEKKDSFFHCNLCSIFKTLGLCCYVTIENNGIVMKVG